MSECVLAASCRADHAHPWPQSLTLLRKNRNQHSMLRLHHPQHALYPLPCQRKHHDWYGQSARANGNMMVHNECTDVACPLKRRNAPLWLHSPWKICFQGAECALSSGHGGSATSCNGQWRGNTGPQPAGQSIWIAAASSVTKHLSPMADRNRFKGSYGVRKLKK
jgi:hypothetical protein